MAKFIANSLFLRLIDYHKETFITDNSTSIGPDVLRTSNGCILTEIDVKWGEFKDQSAICTAR